MQNYLDLLDHLMNSGISKDDRTGIGVKSIFGHQLRFDLADGFPLLTTKKVFLKGVIIELLWYLQGNTNIQFLVKNGVRIWNEWPFQNYLKSNNLDLEFPKYSEKWQDKMLEFVENIKNDDEFAKKWGELGPVYGKQWRDFGGVDQISRVVDQIKNDPTSRRIIVSAWNAGEIDQMTVSGLPPCHAFFQFYVLNGKLSCQLYIRSSDVFLGLPFNIACYATLTMMMAQVCDLEYGDLVITTGDTHIYNNHFEQIKEQLTRTPRKLPTLKINPEKKDIFSFEYSDFELVGYDPYPAIKAPVAV